MENIWEINVTIALNVLYAKQERIYGACFEGKLKSWKTNYSVNDSKWRIMALSCSKKIPALLKEITPKLNGDFYCLNCLHSFWTKNKLEPHKRVCKNKDICNIIMPSEGTEILQFNQYQKPDKAPCTMGKFNRKDWWIKIKIIL